MGRCTHWCKRQSCSGRASLDQWDVSLSGSYCRFRCLLSFRPQSFWCSNYRKMSFTRGCNGDFKQQSLVWSMSSSSSLWIFSRRIFWRFCCRSGFRISSFSPWHGHDGFSQNTCWMLRYFRLQTQFRKSISARTGDLK